MGKIKVAMIGAGGFGYRHALTYHNNANVDFVAVCGRTPEKVKARAEEFGVNAYTDIEEMIDEEKPDFVDVVTQEGDQYNAVMPVLKSGRVKAVLTEKPLGVSVREAYEMVGEARKNKVDFGVDFNRRFAVPYQLAKEWVAGGEIGDIAYMTLKFSHDPYDPPVEKDEYRWFFNVYPHAYDMLTYFAGPVRKVSAFFSKPENHFYYKRFTVNFEFEGNNAVANLIGGGEGKWRHQSEYMEVGGNKGQAVVMNVTEMAVLRKHEEELEQVWKPAIAEGPGLDFFAESVNNHLNMAIDHVAQGKKLPAQAACALYSQILMQATKKSHEMGGLPVDIREFMKQYQLDDLESIVYGIYSK